jgi:5'-methylthioadenosine phosphorylase
MTVKRKIKNLPHAEIGVFGGSGFYDLLENAVEVEVETPFGKPSDKIIVGKIEGRKVAFLPRHARGHKFPPHNIPYRANVWAMKKLGVKRILAPAAVGSLQALIKPGDFVICDQFVNWTRTRGMDKREDTFYGGQIIEGVKKSERVAHFSMAEPYCEELRKNIIKQCQKLNISHHQLGTVVVVEGPRFSTRAESRFFTGQGWHIINMTAYPEVVLARELGLCYANIGLVTDYDVGLVDNRTIKAVTAKEVVRVFQENNKKVKELICEVIKNLPKEKKCKCEAGLEEALI